ncbi:MAG: glycine cleavage system aminomethyltransferase GcvT [Planctomycetes bacterium]|nr:glycine cleavage system aminomethyltransferase GcvT [Planctomycetota bacterium]
MSAPSSLLRTPLHACHQAAGAKLVPFAGWEMPLDYGSILEESRAVRSGAGVFDVSHMARFRFRGPAAAAELDHALGARMDDLEPGKARYSLLLAEDAGILDDLIVYRCGPEEFFMVVNASNRVRDRQAITARLREAALEDLTEDGGGILALQGPESRRMLAALAGRQDFCPAFLDLAWLEVEGLGTLFVARTGYTGEHGYELFAAPGQLEPLWLRLLELGAAPVGLGARDVLRLEAALPLYGHEIHEGTNPFEAGLRFGVRGWKTRDFVGGEALRAVPEAERELIGLTADKRVPREGYPLLAAGRQVGVVCSGIWSATLDRPIATAYLEKGVEGPLAVSARGKEMPVERAALPFVPHRSRD